MSKTYCELHGLGYGHSLEAWQDDELVGGLYGLCLGGVFFGESMFELRTDASKVALHALVTLASGLGIEVIDCQQETPHLASLGARPIPRRLFAAELARLIHSDKSPRRWPRGRLPAPT
jgi:leucyl/phenylalanyl-tRNA--protein transferase